MRSVKTKKFSYIYNAWADGNTIFWNNFQGGLSMNAMKQAAKKDAFISAHIKHFLYRISKEFYNLEKDPDGLVNLIDDPDDQSEINAMRQKLKSLMDSTNDPLLDQNKKQILSS